MGDGKNNETAIGTDAIGPPEGILLRVTCARIAAEGVRLA
jgi:hypothetical protein